MPLTGPLIYQTLRQSGSSASQTTSVPSGLQLGTGVRPVAAEHIFLQGNLSQTSNTLDVAIQGNGFFKVLQSDGSAAYTRDGSFQLNASGIVVDANGNPLDPAINIPQIATNVSIAKDGTVSYLDTANATQTAGVIQLSSFVNPAGLQSIGNNLFVEVTAASGTATSGTAGANGLGTLQQGFVEASNVNVVEEMVNMIQAQRAYELNSKAVQASNEMLQRLVQL